MKSMVLIEPKSSHLHVFSVFGIPRLGTVILGTLLRDRGWQVKVFIEEIAEIDYTAVLSADLVGISTITATAPRAYELARQVRAHRIPVLMGGPHITFLPEEALEYCDYVIRGEAEQAILQFAAAFESGAGYEDIAGLSYRRDGGIVHNPLEKTAPDLNRLPHPDMNLIVGFHGQRGISYKRIVPIQTSRGCPYGCTFCSVTRMFGRRMRFRDLDRVMAELTQYGKVDFVFFYDDHFAMDVKRTKDLLRRMIDAQFGFQWSAQVRIDIAKDKELLRLMYAAGCRMVYIGLESASDEALTAANKGQTQLEMTRAIKAIRKHKIAIHGMFIFGFDSDTLESTRQTWEYAMKQRLDTVQYSILTPFPGTPTYREMQNENRLIIKDWGFYDGHHVVHQPKNMSPVDLQWAQVRAHRRYYSVMERLRSLWRLEFYRALVQRYAKKVNRRWVRENKLYLKAIKLASRADRAIAKHRGNLVIKLDLHTTYTDIRERIEKALAGPRKLDRAGLKHDHATNGAKV